jgi:putative mRNA 3-end processing factor
MYFDRVELVSSQRHREQAVSNQGIFVTTSGMMQGGPVMQYVKALWHDPKHAIFLTGYQCKRTNGRHLVEEGFVYLDGWRTQVKCQVKQFFFSGHSDRPELLHLIKKTNPQHLILQHGDPHSVDAVGEWAKKNTKCKVYTPDVDDQYTF